MGQPTSKLEIRDVCKSYGPVAALAKANLEMREGEFLTLLGPSGSGKTTMLMIVAGLVHPDSGEVWIDGRLATYTPSFRRDIGVVFQNYALFPHLTVFENIAFPLHMRKLPQATIRSEVQRVLQIVRLPEVAQRLPHELSGGQQQRIALARCIVYRPSIILMDEPLGALDKKMRDQMQLEIKHLISQLGITVLYVTHDQEEAMIMSDRICLMNNGQIVQVSTPQELYFFPRSLFSATFLGESNILDAAVAGSEGNVVLLRGVASGTIRAPANADLKGADHLKVMVRPERLIVLAPGEEAANVIEGVIREIILVGGVTKYYVTLADGRTMLATQLTAGRLVSLVPGARVRLGWSIESTVLLSAEAEGDP